MASKVGTASAEPWGAWEGIAMLLEFCDVGLCISGAVRFGAAAKKLG